MAQGVVTALEVQKRDKERVNVYIDGEFAFGLNLLGVGGPFRTSVGLGALEGSGER